MELLAAERDVIALDMPGFGRSPALPEARGHPAGAGGGRRRLHGRARNRARARGRQLARRLGGARARQGGSGAVGVGAVRRRVLAAPLGPRDGPDLRRVVALLLPALTALVRTARPRALLRGSVGHPERVPPARPPGWCARTSPRPASRARTLAMRSAVFSGAERDRGAGHARVGLSSTASSAAAPGPGGLGARASCAAAGTSRPGTTRSRWPACSSRRA